MTDRPTPKSPFADNVAPALADYSNNVLFGDVWKRPGLSPRDRSLFTVACLISLYRTNELPLRQVVKGHRAMDERRTKTLLHP